MENNESNLKPQSTGGLKLMTVFIVVLVLHVVVIGSMTTYYMLKGGSADTDLLTDKTHKGLKANPDGSLVADSTTPDAGSSTAATSPTTPEPDAGTTSSASTTTATPTPVPATEQSASTDATGTLSLGTTPTTESTPTPETTPATVTPAVATTTTTTTTTTPAAANLAPPADPSSTPAPVTTPATPDVAQVAPSTDGTPYVVKSRDSLAKIAHLNHISVAKLKAANSLTSDKLSIGQKLVIPTKTQVAATTPAAATTTDVATTAGATPDATTAPAPVKATADVTPKAAKSSSASLTKAISDHHLYTVLKGDTLIKIAHKFKTTPNALMMANNITDPTKLSIGKKLTIPSREAHTAKTNEPATVQPAEVESKAKAAAQLANINQ